MNSTQIFTASIRKWKTTMENLDVGNEISD